MNDTRVSKINVVPNLRTGTTRSEGVLSGYSSITIDRFPAVLSRPGLIKFQIPSVVRCFPVRCKIAHDICSSYKFGIGYFDGKEIGFQCREEWILELL